MERDAVILKKEKLPEWVSALEKGYKVVAPVEGLRETRYDRISDENELTLEYTRTVIPPKSFIHPPEEKMMDYHREKGINETLPDGEKKTVILGIHSCDARAIHIYDGVFGGDMPDIYYWKRRNKTLLVAITCSIPDEDCFCVSFSDCGPTLEKGLFDLLMTDLGDRYLVEVGSFEGTLLVQFDCFTSASREDFKRKEEIIAKVKGKIADKLPNPERLPEYLKKQFIHDVWNEEAKKCVACGSCTMVCPTCFCYHVEDLGKFNLQEGSRIRMWDSCQLIDFAQVAMGENFRKDKTARLKHRIYHKLSYWQEQFGTMGCTGCGRCMHYCIADIDMTQAIARIREGVVHA